MLQDMTVAVGTQRVAIEIAGGSPINTAKDEFHEAIPDV